MHVRPIIAAELTSLLAQIAAYQRHYGVAEPDDEHNAAFFARFVAPSEVGMLLAAFDDTGSAQADGYACLYWTFSSVSATDVVLLNDLYVRPERRGSGVGEALVAASASSSSQPGGSTERPERSSYRSGQTRSARDAGCALRRGARGA